MQTARLEDGGPALSVLKDCQPVSKMALAAGFFFSPAFLLDHPLSLNNSHYISLFHFLLAGLTPTEVEKTSSEVGLG